MSRDSLTRLKPKVAPAASSSSSKAPSTPAPATAPTPATPAAPAHHAGPVGPTHHAAPTHHTGSTHQAGPTHHAGHTANAPATPSPAPSAPSAPSAPAAEGATFNDPSALTLGSQRDEAIANMEGMGFPRADIDRAMRAAFNNPDRAVEYLLNVRFNWLKMPMHIRLNLHRVSLRAYNKNSKVREVVERVNVQVVPQLQLLHLPPQVIHPLQQQPERRATSLSTSSKQLRKPAALVVLVEEPVAREEQEEEVVVLQALVRGRQQQPEQALKAVQALVISISSATTLSSSNCAR